MRTQEELEERNMFCYVCYYFLLTTGGVTHILFFHVPERIKVVPSSRTCEFVCCSKQQRRISHTNSYKFFGENKKDT